MTRKKKRLARFDPILFDAALEKIAFAWKKAEHLDHLMKIKQAVRDTRALRVAQKIVDSVSAKKIPCDDLAHHTLPRCERPRLLSKGREFLLPNRHFDEIS